MIPEKIISMEEAEKLGFTKRMNKSSGNAIGSIGYMGRGGDGKPDRILEKYLITKSNKKHLIFMSEEREEELKKEGTLPNYLKQFDKIPEELK